MNLLWDRASLIFEEQFGVRRREERERKEGGGERTVFAVCGVRCAVCGVRCAVVVLCTVYCIYVEERGGEGGDITALPVVHDVLCVHCAVCIVRCTVVQ